MVQCRDLPGRQIVRDMAARLLRAMHRFGKTPRPPHCHDFTLGTELCHGSQRLCRGAARASSINLRPHHAALEQLVLAVEKLNTLLTLAHEMQAFANLTQAGGLAVALACGGWWHRVRLGASAHQPRGNCRTSPRALNADCRPGQQATTWPVRMKRCVATVPDGPGLHTRPGTRANGVAPRVCAGWPLPMLRQHLRAGGIDQSGVRPDWPFHDHFQTAHAHRCVLAAQAFPFKPNLQFPRAAS
ncbi:MAG: hypothetical protein IPN53_21015 [Comamonadaceae bacterium]|nr:hypothetical protein [Comamonadaceae bacterium]